MKLKNRNNRIEIVEKELNVGGKRFALVHPQPPEGGFKKKSGEVTGKAFNKLRFKSPLGDLGVKEIMQRHVSTVNNFLLNASLFKVILLTAFLSLSASTTSAQKPLDRYLETAAENNPGLKAAFNEYMAALEKVPQVNSLPDPKVAFQYFVKPIETRMGPQRFKAGVSQMFPWFGTLEAKENAAAQKAKARYQKFKQQKSRLFKEIRAAYFDLYFNEKATEITLENLGILKTFEELVLIKVKAGKASSLDKYRLEMEQGDLENRLAFLRDQENSLRISFNNLLNVEEDSKVQIPDTLWDDEFNLSRQALKDSITSENHKLLTLDYQAKALDYQKKVAEKAGMPDFSVGLGYAVIGKGDMNLQGTDAFIFPKVGISIPLYRDKYEAKVQEVVYRLKAQEQKRQNTENELHSLFAEGWKDYRDALRRVELYKEQSRLARQSMDVLESRYSTNTNDFEEVLRMERKLLKYRLELEKARADQQSAISFIHYLMGK